MKHLAIFFGLLLVIPAASWALMTGLQAQVDSALTAKGAPASHVLCSDRQVSSSDSVQNLCTGVDAVELMREVSLYSGVAGFALPLLFWLVSLAVGANQRALALVFPKLVRGSLIALAIIMLVQGGVLASAAYIGRSYFGEQLHPQLILAGLGALFVCGTLIKHAFTLKPGGEVRVAGLAIDRNAHPNIFALVDHIAQRLGARMPDNVVVGLDPMFFATSTKVQLFDRPELLNGETLYISLPLSRVLTLEEIVAVIGHELGHFRGNDTTYSLRFVPVYAGLGSLIDSLSATGRSATLFHLMILPVSGVVGFMLGLFAKNERRASRIRELAADQASLEVAPFGAFGLALVKSAIFAPLWGHCLAEDANRLEAGLVTRNLSLAVANLVRYDLDREKISASMDEMLQSRLAHPTDSHPPIAERLMAVYREVPRYGSEVLFRVESAKSSALGDLEAIERELTSLQHSFLVRTGASASPQEKTFSDEEKRRLEATNATYVLGATIINADGRLTLAQFATAERSGQELIPGFNRVDFREYCHCPDDSPDAAAAAKTLAEVLNPDGRRLVISWLRGIAHAEPPPSQRSMDWLSYFEHALGQGLNV